MDIGAGIEAVGGVFCSGDVDADASAVRENAIGLLYKFRQKMKVVLGVKWLFVFFTGVIWWGCNDKMNRCIGGGVKARLVASPT